MMEIIRGCIEYLKKGFYIYLAALGLLGLNTLNSLLAKGKSAPPILDINFQPNYFSLAYALLFGFYVLTLFLQVRQFRETIEYGLSGKLVEANELGIVIRFFPWLTSPFRDSAVGQTIFWACLLVGLGRIISLVIAHACFPCETGDPRLFRAIAVFDGVVFLGACYLFYVLRKDIAVINGLVRRVKTNGE
jgi:hypothetical protein